MRARNGSNLYLTLDTEIQYLAETALRAALEEMGAVSGTILVMNPRSGEILAIASLPDYDPNRHHNADPSSTRLDLQRSGPG